MKPMKVETCPTCGWKTIRRATCADCQMLDWGHRSGDLCYRGRTAKRLCKEFIPCPGVEIVKERKDGEMSCECLTWATLDVRHQLLTGHHERCPHRPDALTAAVELIAEMAHGMERWAADEDGIHPDAWKAYRRAKALQGKFLPVDPD